jgi:regulation of enolase protein 1 (concanavalin A-like superfamily)
MQRGRYVFLAAVVGALVMMGEAGGSAYADVPGWSDQTFGDTLQGSASVDANGIWTVRGAGSDTWERSDEFHIVYKPLTGNGSVTTKLLTAPEGHNSNKIGVIMRNDLQNPAAAVIELHMTTAGVEVLHRGVDGQLMGLDHKAAKDDWRVAPRKLPIWLKIERRGDRFTPYLSDDGALWIPATGPQQLQMKDQIVAGVFVTAISDEELLTATFDGKVTDVSDRLLKPEEATPLQPFPVVALGGNNSVLLTWDRVNHLGKEADGYIVYKAPVDGGDFEKVKELPADQTSYVDEQIQNGEIARYRVTTVVKVGAAGDTVLESRDNGGQLYEIRASPNPPLKIGDRQFNANILEGGWPVAFTETPGTASVDDQGVVTLRASGIGFGTAWDTARTDGGEQLLTPVTGDFTFTARLVKAPTADGGEAGENAKFGIMLRESTMTDSRNAGILVSPTRGVRSPHRRLFSSGYTEDLGPNETAPTYPIYLRVQRRGDEIRMFTSTDGQTFAEYGSPASTVLFGLAPQVYVGLVGSSGDPDQVAEAQFDSIQLSTP